MKITAINCYNRPNLHNSLKQNSTKTDNNSTTDIIQPRYSVSFYGFFNKRKTSGTQQDNSIQSLKSRQNYSVFSFYNTPFDTTSCMKCDPTFNASPLCQASPQKAKEARDICKKSNRHWYIPDLYLRSNSYVPCVFKENLYARDLSAVPDILLGIEVLNSQGAKQNYYLDIMRNIYDFVIEYNSKDEYSDELCNLYDTVKSKYLEAGGNEKNICWNRNDMNISTVSDSIKFGRDSILPDPKVLTTPENVLKTMDNKILKRTGGRIWNKNGNIICAIADIVPTEENKENYAKMISALKKLTMIDYDQKDSYGISVLENF